MSVPVGAIAVWMGTIISIPTGWLLCDGTGGLTPDLRDKFVRGAYNAGGTGGSATNTHTINNGGVAHTHTFESTGAHTHNTNSAGTHTHGENIVGGDVGEGLGSNEASSGAHSHTVNSSGAHTHTSASATPTHGHTQVGADETRPPYYDVLYIQATVTATVAVGLVIIWTGTIANIPSGWSEKTELREKFIRGASNGANAGGTGGALTHTHLTDSQGAHTHTASDSQGAHSHTFNSLNVEHNHFYTYVGASDTTPSIPVQTTENNLFTHTHANTDSIGAHTHTLDSGGAHTHTSQSTSSLPAYYDVKFIKNDSASTIPTGGILIWVGSYDNLPYGYTACIDSYNTGNPPSLSGKFIRGAASGVEAGGTGGADTHVHTDTANTHNHTQTTFNTNHTHANTDSIGAHSHGTTDWTYVDSITLLSDDTLSGNHSHSYSAYSWSHTHTITVSGSHTHTINSGSSLPPYYEVIFMYKDVLVTLPVNDGYENNNFNAFTGTKRDILGTSATTIGSGYKKDGSYGCLHSTPAASTAAFASIYTLLSSPEPTLYAKWDVYVDLATITADGAWLGFGQIAYTKPQDKKLYIGMLRVSGVWKWYIGYRNGADVTWVALSTPLPSLQNWYTIKLKSVVHATAGEARVYIDGTEVATYTGLTNNATGDNGYIEIGGSRETAEITAAATWTDNIKIQTTDPDGVAGTPDSGNMVAMMRMMGLIG